MFTPLAISVGAITIAHANGLSDRDSFARPASRACFASASYAALAKLPQGLVIGDVSLGPYLLALTPHSVVGAPYHRLFDRDRREPGRAGLVARRFRGMVTATKLIGSGGKPVYIAVCGPRPPDEPRRSRKKQ